MKTLFHRDSIDEIVFERRNKHYGAYRLRSEYHATLSRSLLITLGAFGLVAGMFLLFRKSPAPLVHLDEGRLTVYEIDLTPPVIPRSDEMVKPDVKSPEAPSAPEAPVFENTYRPVDELPVEPVVHSSGPMSTPGTGNAPSQLGGELAPGGSPSGSFSLPAAPMEAALADKAPEFPGGLEKFQKYLKDNLRYSVQARELGISGRVYATFIIGSDGKPREVKIIKGLGYGLDEEVLSVLSNSPSWQPGIYHGQPVATIFRIPVSFALGK